MRGIVRNVVRAASLLAFTYVGAYRPWELRWGATAAEAADRLPGDDLVPVAQ